MKPEYKKHLKGIGLLILCATVFIPVLGYVVGSAVVGPYEGDGGLPGYLGTIYVSALRGERAALTLLFAPGLIVIVWLVGLWLFRRAPAEKAGSETA